ncbi:MAG: ABC transporter ATP-binding protein [Gammaproteobacteria bacterium]|nr:MAG: ABC transporter ATP-binding protein [Gammaproteobacteria bacterium]
MALLEVTNASVQFGGLVAVNHVTFEAEPGKVRSIIGPNGAGKTTLFKAIAGEEELSSGSIMLQGEPIHTLAPHVISARGIRRTFQNGGLFGELTALENILAGLHTRIDSSLGGLVFGSRTANNAERAGTKRARELLEMMGIQHVADQLARDLSGGQKRMVEIVRALATDPPLLLLDEPAVGLAPPVALELRKIVRRLVEDENIAVILIEHAIEFVMTVSDTIMVLNNGEVIAEGPPDEVRQNREVLEAYLGR